MQPNDKIEQQNTTIANLVLELAAERQRADMLLEQGKLAAAQVQAEQQRIAALGEELAAAKAAVPAQTGMPFMYAIMAPDGHAHIDECCVAGNPEALYLELNGLNDSPDAGYTIVPVYAAQPVQPVQQPAPVGYVFGNSYWEEGNPRLTDEIRQLGQPRYAAPVAAPVAMPAASAQPDADLVKRLTHERDALGQAIADAALKAGMYNGEVPLGGPQLIMFAQHLGEAASVQQDSGRDAALVAALGWARGYVEDGGGETKEIDALLAAHPANVAQGDKP